MALLLFSTQAFVEGRSQQRTKGQIFGSGLQLCASGAPAEPESVTPYRDQRHPHTVKCQAQRRARELKSTRGRQRQNMFYSVGELRSGTLERAGLDTEHYHAHSPAVAGKNARQWRHSSVQFPLSPLCFSQQTRLCIQKTCQLLFR